MYRSRALTISGLLLAGLSSLSSAQQPERPTNQSPTTELLFYLGGKPTFVPTTVRIDVEAVQKLLLTTDRRVSAYAQALVQRHTSLLDVLFQPKAPTRVSLAIAVQRRNLPPFPQGFDVLDLTGNRATCCFWNWICLVDDSKCAVWCCEHC
jgi:hypothetical protein